jgi:uncharacterized protein (TIGR02001 family)
MNKMTKLAAAIALTTGALATAPVMAEAEYSATAGFVTDYYFRGSNLGDAGAYGSLDAAVGGFYAGTWIISDNGGDGRDGGDDGLETDFYVGYGFEFENGLWVDVAYNMYEYTYTSDSESEIALSVGMGAFSVSYVDGDGDWDEEDPTAEEGDYTYASISWSGEVFGATVGAYEDEGDNNDWESEYKHFEVTASGEVVGLDVTATLGKTFAVDSDTDDDASGDGYFFLDVSKSFDL